MKKLAISLLSLTLLFGSSSVFSAELPYFVRGYVDIYDYLDYPETKILRYDWDFPVLEGHFTE